MSLRSVLKELRGSVNASLFVANWVPCAFPASISGRLRPRLLRLLAGVAIGPDTFLASRLELNPGADVRRNLRIGSGCYVNRSVYLDAIGCIIIGDGVYVGHHARIVTSHHEIGPPGHRAGRLSPRTVVVGNGAWLASGVTLLPGITVGAGAIVAAGAVVTRDVAPNTLVGGVPAKVIREL